MVVAVGCGCGCQGFWQGGGSSCLHPDRSQYFQLKTRGPVMFSSLACIFSKISCETVNLAHCGFFIITEYGADLSLYSFLLPFNP